MTTPTPSPDVRRNNLDEIKSVWLQQCGSCDYGLGYSCTCPAGDYRPVVMNLVDEVEALRAQMSAVSRQIANEIADAISDNVRNEDWSKQDRGGFIGLVPSMAYVAGHDRAAAIARTHAHPEEGK